MKPFRRSLMIRLVTYFFVLSLIIASLIGYVSFVQARDSLKQSVFDRLSGVSILKEAELNRWVYDQRDNLLFIVHSPEMHVQTKELFKYGENSSEYKEAYSFLSAYLNSIVINNTNIEEILILTDKGGRIILSTNKTHEGQYRVKDRYFKEGKLGTFIQEVYPSPVTGNPTMTVAMPLINGTGYRLGVIVSHLNLDRLYNILLERTGLGETGETYLVNKFNVFISEAQFGGEKFPRGVHTQGIDSALGGIDGHGLYKNYNDKDVIGVYRWIEEREMALIAEMQQDEAFLPARNLALMILFVGLVCISLLAAGVYVLARRITHPILAIANAAKKVSSGDLTSKAPVLTEDEVGTLAISFNRMTNQLRDMVKNLEKKVAERTAKLATTNKHLKNEIIQRKKIEQSLVEKDKKLTEINKKLEDSNEKLKGLDKAKDEFISIAAHELKTPLTSIKGFAQLMNTEKIMKDGKKMKHYLNLVNENTTRLYKLVLDVVDSSRLSLGNLRLDIKEINVNEIFNNIKENMGLVIKEKGIKPLFSIEERMPRIKADPERLLQVIRNIIVNATHFTPEGGTISLKIYKKGKYVQFEINDTGEGIPKNKQKNIFSKFYQADSSAMRKVKGSGLGLSICKGLVEMMGGKIWFESEEGKGTAFYFTVPIKK